MLARTVLALSLAVRVYDNTGLDRADRANALAVAHDILRDAGVDVAWREGRDADDPPAATDLILRIVGASPQTPPDSLGFSLVDVERRTGTLATVFADRVASLAALAGADVGRLLGRAMAHEIGHLLVGTTRHADRGLMRSTWTTVELQRDQPWDWEFGPDDVARLRRGLIARARRVDPPAAVAQTRTARTPRS